MSDPQPQWSERARELLSLLNPAELREADKNPRTITEERYQALKYALSSDPGMLEARPIIATPDGEVVAGNMRLRAALDLGWEQVPVYIADLDEKRKREWMLRDNVPYGDWVPSEVAELVREHDEDGGDLELLGFTGQERDDLQKLDQTERPQGDEPTKDLPVVYAVVIECDTDEQQAELLEEMAERDLKARAVLV